MITTELIMWAVIGALVMYYFGYIKGVSVGKKRADKENNKLESILGRKGKV